VRSGAEKAQDHLLRNRDETAHYVAEDARRYVLEALRSNDFLLGLRSDLCGALVNLETVRIVRDDVLRPTVRSPVTASLSLELACSQITYWLSGPMSEWSLDQLVSLTHYLLTLPATYDLLRPTMLRAMHDRQACVTPLADLLVSDVIPELGMKDTLIESVHDLATNEAVLDFSKRTLIGIIRKHQNKGDRDMI